MKKVGGYTILNTTVEDINITLSFFKSAVEYQKMKGYDLWPDFSSKLIEDEITDNRHFKIMLNNSIVCVFSIQYNDPVIWKEKDKDPSVYLHRIAVNPLYKGKRLMEIIKEWSVNHAQETGRKFVRMDTWGNNINIRNYYISCGFEYIGQQQLSDTDESLLHYGGNLLSLFELKV